MELSLSNYEHSAINDKDSYPIGFSGFNQPHMPPPETKRKALKEQFVFSLSLHAIDNSLMK